MFDTCMYKVFLHTALSQKVDRSAKVGIAILTKNDLEGIFEVGIDKVLKRNYIPFWVITSYAPSAFV